MTVASALPDRGLPPESISPPSLTDTPSTMSRGSSSHISPCTSNSMSPDTDTDSHNQHTPTSFSCSTTPTGPSFDMRLPASPVAKAEPMDEDEEDSKTALANIPAAQPPAKRGRGRPRKHPLPLQGGALTKNAKGRSKTGCKTCRRRKKKCDETKPECMNCKKNAVVCEGYPEPTIWQSGRQKTDGQRQISHGPDDMLTVQVVKAATPYVPPTLPCLIDGVETDMDRYLLSHFVNNLSRVLTLFTDDKNPFQEIVVPLATKHQGLMHSLLCVSSSHLARKDRRYVTIGYEHYGQAVKHLQQDIADGITSAVVDDTAIATTLLLCLNSICNGDTDGEYRQHMDGARRMLTDLHNTRKESIGAQTPFSLFLFEFFMYHDVLNSVTAIDRRPLLMNSDYELPRYLQLPQTGALVGVNDGLFVYLSKTTVLRDKIRGLRNQGHQSFNYEMLSEAMLIDEEIRKWRPSPQTEPARYHAAMLYRLAVWIYLWRTTQPPEPSEKIRAAVNEGIDHIRHIVDPNAGGVGSIMLMPVFLLGIAAFDPAQRDDIRDAFRTLKGYSDLGNIDPSLRVVEEVWKLMDAKDDANWDWEDLISKMGLDFLIT